MSGNSSWRSGLAAIALAVVAAWTSPLAAAEVTLRMKGGDFAVTGVIIAFDGSRYTIESKTYGTMTLDATRFDCAQGSCPSGPYMAPVTPMAGRVPERVTIAGSDVIGSALMPALVQAYATSIGAKAVKIVGNNPAEMQLKINDAQGREIGSIDLKRQGTHGGFSELERKAAHIAMASRPISAAEAQRFVTLGLPSPQQPGRETVLALDGLLAIVSTSNTAVSISLDNLARIFAGQVTDWSELGVAPGKINLYAGAEDNGTDATFETLVMQPRNLTVAPSTKRVASHAELADLVAKDANGIGIVGIADQRSARALNIEASCGLITRPSAFAIKAEEYPLNRRLYLYTASDLREQLGRGVLAYAVSAAAQPVVKQLDFVDQSVEMLDFSQQTYRIAYALNAGSQHFDMDLMRNLIAELKPAKRLSITFRFQPASVALDSRAMSDIKRLRDLLVTPAYAKKTVLLVGFADAVGGWGSNLRIAERRATTVARALTAAGIQAANVNLATRAYGELAPVSCNDSLEARNLNRRVEVWIKD